MSVSSYPILVQKFGGTSVANAERIKKVALKVKAEVDRGYRVVVVVSAMAGETDRLLGEIHKISSGFDRGEYDAILSSGEQVTAGLLTIALKSMGVPARSWLGWQIPIVTSSTHANAVIEDVVASSLKDSLDQGNVAVIAGFQGICREGRITTLGRGGSDTTAVAVAAALKAERCDIYTDVDGVYTADPRLVANAGRIDQIAYHEMLELAAQGAKVLQKDSVEYAMRHGVPLRVLSSLKEAPGTMIAGQSSKVRDISGVAHSFHKTQILVNLPWECKSPETDLRQAFKTLGIVPEMCAEKMQNDGRWFSFVIDKAEEDRAESVMETLFPNHTRKSARDFAKISIVGNGVRHQQHIPFKVFRVIESAQIPIHGVSTSDIQVSFLLHKDHVERALGILHSSFELDMRSDQ